MSAFFTNLLAFIVAISVLVAVHEYGHYIIGRLLGMKVLRFSIGFGKPIWTWVRGEDRTEYCISSIPLGGYVRFLDGREGPVPPEDEGRAFNHRPIPARIAVLLAGPVFNLVFAVFAYWLVAMDGIPASRPAVGEVAPQSYAAEAGLEHGDRIISIGETPTPSWERALIAMFDHMVEDGRIPMTLEDQDGYQRQTEVIVEDTSGRLTEPGMLFDGLGFRPGAPPVIVDVPLAGHAAEAAGVRKGDRIVGIEDDQILHFGHLVDAVQKRPNERVAIHVIRDGRRQQLFATIGVSAADEQVGYLGVGSLMEGAGPLEAVPAAFERTWASSAFMLRMLGRMVTGDVSIKNISGPLSIAQVAGESAQRGMRYFLDILALVSISLGILNLLPIPVLDGGQIVYQSLEAAKGSPLSERAQIIGQQVGILALVLLMGFAFYNDFARIFG